MVEQIGKQSLTLIAFRGVLCRLLAVLCLALPAAAHAQPTTRVAVDPLTGVAMGGWDPVSYFAGARPERGSPAYSQSWRGVTWYFASAANRDAFTQAPTIYAPQFGGYGAMALARGHLSHGNPEIYAVLGERLFLFYSIGNREAFAARVAPSVRAAADHWQALEPRHYLPLVLPENVARSDGAQ